MKILLKPYESPFYVARESTDRASIFYRKCIFCRKKISMYHGFQWTLDNWDNQTHYPRLSRITKKVWIGPCCILKKDMYQPSYSRYGYVVDRKLVEQIEKKLR